MLDHKPPLKVICSTRVTLTRKQTSKQSTSDFVLPSSSPSLPSPSPPLPPPPKTEKQNEKKQTLPCRAMGNILLGGRTKESLGLNPSASDLLASSVRFSARKQNLVKREKSKMIMIIMIMTMTMTMTMKINSPRGLNAKCDGHHYSVAQKKTEGY